MSCVKPLKAFWRSRSRDAITFDVNKSATRISFVLPCGRCIGCRMERARQWGLRCLHEKKMSSSSCFLTLTYNNDCLPEGGTVVVRDLQLFMKRLHNRLLKKRGFGIRYFAGAEYGETNRRPHYHALIFNYDFPDKLIFSKNGRGEIIYTSAECSELWPLGFNSIGEVTMESAVYCAKYAMKKLNISDASSDEAKAAYEKRYVVYDADGVVYERVPEFAIMSRRPGIGASYYEKYGREVRDHDAVVVSGRECRPPRFYDTRSEGCDPSGFAVVKAERKRAAVKDVVKADNTPERLRVKEKLLQYAADKKERKL